MKHYKRHLGIPKNDEICKQWRMFSCLLFLPLQQHNDTKEYNMVITTVRRNGFIFILPASWMSNCFLLEPKAIGFS